MWLNIHTTKGANNLKKKKITNFFIAKRALLYTHWQHD